MLLGSCRKGEKEVDAGSWGGILGTRDRGAGKGEK
jgi:hypothetical protein